MQIVFMEPLQLLASCYAWIDEHVKPVDHPQEQHPRHHHEMLRSPFRFASLVYTIMPN